jgi:hypothetical protein
MMFSHVVDFLGPATDVTASSNTSQGLKGHLSIPMCARVCVSSVRMCQLSAVLWNVCPCRKAAISFVLLFQSSCNTVAFR